MEIKTKPKKIDPKSIAILISTFIVFLSGARIGYYYRLSKAEYVPPKQSQVVSKINKKNTNNYEQQYKILTHRRSYFAINASGNLEKRQQLPYKEEKKYSFKRTVAPSKTAIIIMDPWIDNPTKELNNWSRQTTESYIIPLTNKALSLGHPIIILTNKQEFAAYSSKINKKLKKLTENNQADLLFHQDLNNNSFANYLHQKNINTLIYTGFSSNMCLIGRETGMISMRNHGFRLFYVPEASRAIEYKKTWNNQRIHQTMTIIISQWLAEIMHFKDFMKTNLIEEKISSNSQTS